MKKIILPFFIFAFCFFSLSAMAQDKIDTQNKNVSSTQPCVDDEHIKLLTQSCKNKGKITKKVTYSVVKNRFDENKLSIYHDKNLKTVEKCTFTELSSTEENLDLKVFMSNLQENERQRNNFLGVLEIITGHFKTKCLKEDGITVTEDFSDFVLKNQSEDRIF